MSVNLSDQFVDDLFELCEVGFPDAVVHQAKRCLLDYLGSTLAGAQLMQAKGEKLLDHFGTFCGDASVIGFGRKIGAENAAFVNGLSSHVAELDDGVISGIVHPGSPVLSALLPVAEKEKVKGDALLKGIIFGYEVSTRIADAIQPSHKKRGYHATGTCGSIGAALGIAAMLDFSKSQMKDVLSAVAVSAHGTPNMLEDDSELKPYNVAQAAICAVLAASMGRAGFKGPNDVFSGKTGFFSIMADELDEDQLRPKEGDTFAVERVYVKPYAACRYCHPAIDAALKIRTEQSLRPEMVEFVKVATYELAVSKHDHSVVNNISSAKMSIPYSTAVALVVGKAGIGEYSDECITNPEIAALAKKVIVRADDDLTALFPRYSAALVEIKTVHGKCFIERIDSPKGEAEFPLSDLEMEEKCVSLAMYAGKSEGESQKIIKTVWNLENELPNLFELL